MNPRLKHLAVSVALAIGTLSATAVMAGATLINTAGTLAIGVNDEGHLNTSVGSVAVNTEAGHTGIAYKFPDGAFRDATAPGCLCEGWGVSVNGTTSGFANVSTDGGASNLTVGSFAYVPPVVLTPGTITSLVSLTNLPGLKVTHAYQEATNAPAELFRVHVTIENTTGAALTDVKYVRVMDWDVPPTEFAEFVTIRGTGTTTLLERSHDNGFNTANPLGGDGPILGGTTDVDFDRVGVADHGAYFRFNFGSLGIDEKYEFDIFYGAAATRALAEAAIAAEDIELFSLGQSNLRGAVANDDAPTYIFGFAGVGGTPVFDVPEPGSLALAGLGLAALAGLRRRRKLA